MKIPIANTLNDQNYIQTKANINLEILNNLKLKKINIKRYPISKTLSLIGNKTSLFDTVIITANDQLVERFLKNEISFQQIHKFFFKIINLKEFTKYKKKNPRNINDILKLRELVSFKIQSKGI